MNRVKRHKRIRKSITGTANKPRVAVFRSNKHIQVQLIDDVAHKTLYGMSTESLDAKKANKVDQARELGVKFGELLSKDGKVTTVVFDRGGYKYHGRVKALAESLREKGLKF
jgi:large subunit ribosomal protein L18